MEIELHGKALAYQSSLLEKKEEKEEERKRERKRETEREE